MPVRITTAFVRSLTAQKVSTLSVSDVMYENLCETYGFEATPSGWGLIHCVTPSRNRYTMVVPGADHLLASITQSDNGDFEWTASYKCWCVLYSGWPDDWSTGTKPVDDKPHRIQFGKE